MPSLARFQEDFAAALFGAPSPGLVDAFRDPDGAARLAVYRNNVVTAWAGAVVRNHPAVERLVGVEFIRGAAVAYVRARPPRARDLTLAGEGFAAFLREFPPAACLPYLPDVAALDRAWLEALFAAETRALDAAALAGLPPDAMATLAPGLVASARVASSSFPAYSIWRANREGDGDPRVALNAGGETALLWRASRHGADPGVRHRRLAPGEAAFVRALCDGATFTAAGEASAAADPEFDLTAAFAGLLSAGVLAASTHEVRP